MNSGWWIGALIVGVALGVLWRGAGEPMPSAPPSAQLLRDVGDPRPRADAGATLPPLETETAERVRLEARIAALEARVDALSVPSASEPAGESADEAFGERETQATRWFDEEALRAGELRPETIAVLRKQASAYEMEQLLLRDQAVREGWIGTPRYREERQASVDGLRSELGEDWFDWVLYASGRSNRVWVEDVLGESPAARVGLKPGDVLRSYDDLPLYNPRDLQSGISAGDAGESVVLVIDRGDETVELYVPRGPLGIRLNASRVVPATPLN